MNRADEILRDYDNGYFGVDLRQPIPATMPEGPYNIFWVMSASEKNVEWGVTRQVSTGRFTCACKGFTTRGYCRHAEEALRMFREEGPGFEYTRSGDVVPVRRSTLENLSSTIDSMNRMNGRLLDENKKMEKGGLDQVHEIQNLRAQVQKLQQDNISLRSNIESGLRFSEYDEVVYETRQSFPEMHVLRVARHDEMIGFEVAFGDDEKVAHQINRFIEKEEFDQMVDLVNQSYGQGATPEPAYNEEPVVDESLILPDTADESIKRIFPIIAEHDPELARRVVDLQRREDDVLGRLAGLGTKVFDESIDYEQFNELANAVDRDLEQLIRDTTHLAVDVTKRASEFATRT